MKALNVMKKINLAVTLLTLLCISTDFFAGNCTSSATVGASNNRNENAETAPRRNQPVEQTYYDSQDSNFDNFEVMATFEEDQSQNNINSPLNDSCKTVVCQYNNQITKIAQKTNETTFKN